MEGSLEAPRLRYVEATRASDGSGRYILRDPMHLAQGALVVHEVQLLLLSLLDGQRSQHEIQSEFARRTGQLLTGSELNALLQQLNAAGYLEGEGFEAYYQRLLDEYRAAPFRELRDPDSYGAPARRLHAYLDQALEEAALPSQSGKLRGLIAPHLDFPRGMPCYAAAFRSLRDGLAEFRPRRVVVLGTNHWGRSRSVVATEKDFQTPWGVVPTDRSFLGRLGAELGGNLMPYELDHLREHSVELPVIWLHHVLGNGFQVVPVLCPDPSRRLGTRAGDPDGVDLKEFSLALGEAVRRDPVPTLLLASADLSHMGQFFDDEEPLSEKLLESIRETDDAALAWVDRNSPEEYRRHMAATGNPTKHCSVGCIYTLMTALGSEAQAHRLEYHQAVTIEIDNAVTCAAYAFR